MPDSRHPYFVMEISSSASSLAVAAPQFQRRWSGLIPLTLTLLCLIFQVLTASKETDAAMIVIDLNPAAMSTICYISAAVAGISIFIGLFFVADTTGERSYVGSCCTGLLALLFSFGVAIVASLIVYYWNQDGGKYVCGHFQACQDAKTGMSFAWVAFGAILLAEISWCVINKSAVVDAKATGTYFSNQA